LEGADIVKGKEGEERVVKERWEEKQKQRNTTSFNTRTGTLNPNP
jgi:hypothetical protein